MVLAFEGVLELPQTVRQGCEVRVRSCSYRSIGGLSGEPVASDTLRCFVALDLPDSIRSACADAQRALASQRVPELRYTAVPNLHLTLKFLGRVDRERVEEVAERLAGVRGEALEVRLVEMGCFAPRIVWVRLGGAEALQNRVDQSLVGLFEPEHRFMGHVTLARTRSLRRADVDRIRSLPVPAAPALCTRFSLQRSTLSPEGPQYETLRAFPLP